MEDSSLDDFFAKKDKSKKKSKVKSVEKEDRTKSATSTTTKKEKRKDKPTKITSQNSSTGKTQEKKPVDDEWNDFEEERAVDYSGLRIQNLQQKEEAEKDFEGDEEELDENGDVKEKKDRKDAAASGPWNKSGHATAPVAAQREEEKKPAPTPVNTGKYIPPSQRAAMAAAARGGSGLPGKRGKKDLPNIRSDVDFPTLSAMSISDSSSQQSSGHPSHTPSSIQDTTTHHRAAGALTLENKFAVLQD